jgi:DNA (cytosine-5)-methyltransferase 1
MAMPSTAMPGTALPPLPYPVTEDPVRSATMSAIRSTNTKPEVAVRSALHRLGYRFRKEHKVRAAGRLRSIDIAFPALGLAVFVDGCYWHQCPEHGTVPKTNRDYWVPKLKRNVARDALVTTSLKQQGWTVLRVWEHTAPAAAAKLIAAEADRLRRRAARRKTAVERTAADLFAGAGGSTAGLKQAGYQVLGAIEFDPHCAATYRANHPEVSLAEEDIKDVAPADFRAALGVEPGDLGLLNACPPCQGFSSLGATDADDRRNDLVTTVASFIGELRPRAFVVENVPGLARDQRLKDLLAEARVLGYGVATYRVNATDFGVPQNRRRLIAIGVMGAADEALPEHPAELLPVSFCREPRPIAKVLAEAGPVNGADPVHRGRTPTPEVAERIRQIPRNGSRFDLPESYQLECHKSLDSKRSAAASYGRMRLNEPAPTLTTRCTTPACGRFLHPTKHRGITLREAALIQTFPRRYRFKGTYQAIEGQIGNAVPVRMAEGLALAAAELLLEAADG